MNEFWIDVDEYEDELQISNLGRIRLINVGTTQLVDGEYQTTITPEVIIKEIDVNDTYLVKAIAHIHEKYPHRF